MGQSGHDHRPDESGAAASGNGPSAAAAAQLIPREREKAKRGGENLSVPYRVPLEYKFSGESHLIQERSPLCKIILL